MASPFATFRRNQKVLLAVVSIAAIFAFVFLDPLVKFVGRQSTPENPVVVETRYGSLTQRELAIMRQSRELVQMFLRMLTAETVNAQIQKGLLDPRAMNQAADQTFNFWATNLMQRSVQGPEQSAVETFVLAKQAEQMGMVVSDNAISDLLEQISENVLPRDTILAIVGNLQSRPKVSVNRLFDAIRPEMLASQYSHFFMLSLRDVTPAQRYEFFAQLNRRAKAEVMPLAVADFVSQVADPDDTELKKFFDEFKNDLPNPDSAQPGFKEPLRAAFQYFKADMAKFKDEAKPKVTEDEIREYYNTNKAQFRELPIDKDAAGADKDGTDKEGANKDGADKKDDAAKDATGAAAPDGGEAAPKGEAAPQDDAAAAPKDESTSPPAEPKPEPPQDAAPPAEPKSARTSRTPFRLVSATADDEPPAAAAPAPAETAPAEAAPAEAAQTTPPAEGAAAATESPADAQAGEEGKKPAEPAAGEAPATDKADAEKPAEEVKYEPLEKVQDQIRDSLANQKAAKRISEIFEELQATMRRYAQDREFYEAEKANNVNAKPPTELNFEALAKDHGLEAKTLAPITAAEAAAMDLGSVRRLVQDRRSQFGFRSEAFVDFAFATAFPLFSPNTVEDNEGNGYLFWKTKVEESFVPSLDEVRAAVVQAWKMIKARPLATKRGEELVQQARALNKPLKEVFANQATLNVTETDSFSWLTMGNVPFAPRGGAPRIGEVEGVEVPGEKFMKTVFGLSVGGLGVTTNQPENIVYVVRAVEFDPDDEVLRRDFANANPTQYQMAEGPQRRKLYQTWLDGINQQARVEWVRPADSVRQQASSDEPFDDSDL